MNNTRIIPYEMSDTHFLTTTIILSIIIGFPILVIGSYIFYIILRYLFSLFKLIIIKNNIIHQENIGCITSKCEDSCDGRHWIENKGLLRYRMCKINFIKRDCPNMKLSLKEIKKHCNCSAIDYFCRESVNLFDEEGFWAYFFSHLGVGLVILTVWMCVWFIKGSDSYDIGAYKTFSYEIKIKETFNNMLDDNNKKDILELNDCQEWFGSWCIKSDNINVLGYHGWTKKYCDEIIWKLKPKDAYHSNTYIELRKKFKEYEQK